MADKALVEQLEAKAKELRIAVLQMIHAAKSGHPGGSLSAADWMTALYFNELNVRPEEPKWEDRDRFVLSKGHVCPIQYTCLGMRGFFPAEVMGTLRQEGSMLQGHPDMKRCPGIDISTGSLGQGFSVAVGMALAAKRDGKDYRTFCVVGDGETNEGQIWEAAMTANKYDLNNLVVFIDNNGLQNDNTSEVVMPHGDIAAKFAAFGFDTYKIDGHNMEEIVDVLDTIRTSTSNRPKCVVGKTVKGKGVSFMENVVVWHGVAPNDEELAHAIKDIQEGF